MFGDFPAARSPRAGFCFPSVVWLRLTPLAVVLAVLALAGSAMGAQITGTVTDPAGAPLPGTRVQVAESRAQDIADRDGCFRLTGLDPGSYAVTATRLGFEPGKRFGIRVKEGGAIHIRLMLQPQPIPIPPVVVESRGNLPVEISGNRAVVHLENGRPAGTATVGEALRLVPGVSLMEGDGRQRLSLRGSPPRTAQVYLDGIPLNDPATGEADVSVVDIDRIARMEVEFTGLGGSVYLATDHLALRTDSIGAAALSAGVGGSGRSVYGMRVTSRGESASAEGGFRRITERGDFEYRLDDGSSRRRVNNQRALWSGVGGVSLGSARWIAGGELFGDADRRGIPGLLYGPPTPKADLSSRKISARIGLQGKPARRPFSATGYFSRFVGVFRNPAEQYDPSTGETVLQIPEHTRQQGMRWGINSSLTQSLPGGSLGLNYRWQADEYLGEDLLRGRNTVGGVGTGSAWRSLHEGELGWRWGIARGSRQFEIHPTAAVRKVYESGGVSHQYLFPALSASLSRRFDAGDLQLSAGWGRSLSAPPFNARFLAESIYAVGNPNLKPEKGEAINWGALFSLPAGRTICGYVSLNFFRRRTDDLIVWRRNFQGKYYPDNLARTRGFGVESSARFELPGSRISVYGNYIYHRAWNDNPGDINRGRRVPLIPEHSGVAGGSIDIRRATASLTARWAGRRYGTESNRDAFATAGVGLPPYLLWDFSLQRPWRWRRAVFFTQAGLENLLNDNYRIVERSPMPGRTWSERLTFSIKGASK